MSAALRALSAALLLGLLAPACTGSARRASARLEGRYQLGKPGDGWESVRTGGADFGWYHPELSASIYADSNCLARYEDGELADLLVHLTSGIARGAPVEDRAFSLDGRAAHLRRWKGSLDGVAVDVGAVVSKKDECIYDVVYIAPPASASLGWPAFEAVVAGFTTGGF